MMMGKAEVPKHKELKTAPGRKGNLITIERMKGLARARHGHPKIRELAKNITIYDKIPSMCYADEAKAIARYVQKNVRYLRDANGIEQIYDPLTLLDQMMRGVAAADCDDMALLIATLLLSIGCQPYFRAVRYQSKNKKHPYNHIYTVVYEKNLSDRDLRRISLDAIIKHKPIGFEVPHVSGDEFRV